MKRILAIKSSILGANSQSSQLIDYLLEGLEADIKVRDLAAEPIPVLDLQTMGALGSSEPNAVRQLSDTLIQEVKDADLVVIAAPMYNFAIPTQLKNWIDLISRAGVTFRYTSSGSEGLIKDTRALVITTRGGQHKDNGTDFEAPYLKTVLGFLGIPAEFVYVEGLAMSKVKEAAIEDARKELLAYK
ncbi:NADH-azoreductase, FMN-dependent [Carpediemonas membranifera]|uniref:FMN-dependent NADH-azoreductase n=1 Tax=Carpediemonas membranifera TaxID=201153 RepID=A0A8J6BFX6_9EUKA|nr:NADH-azoreductase, FMN-dependent [Carpediemonas membranifera]KAG9396660.1 FMN-dependent NADH-azoreductase [Carpediemonas membranifera]KAG9396674.1 NADH-azoreductase, FMN-dependent [Carpediemonas membranifera]|eukprot:KAG9396657.1 NADH-azoreductase, FMN-dependent [Carpediemonas membranifera]